MSDPQTGAPKANGIVCFGELLLRLSPPGKRLIVQAQTLDIDVGGAEANVAAALAALGHDTRMVSSVPDNPLGRLAKASLAAAGVDTRHVGSAPGRMGLYFLEAGQGLRASAITYDRAGSAFALAGPQDFDFATALDGAALLHISGITPALGADNAAAVIAALDAAEAQGVPVSFDGNYRAQLWKAWDSDPRAILTQIVARATILLGNHRDIALLLGRSFSGDGAERRRAAAQAAFDAFPALQLVASTARHVVDADHHRIAARADRRDGGFQTEEAVVTGIVDRIGTGDAFAAGVIDQWLAGGSAQEMAETGLALAALKHSLPGDMARFSRADVTAYLSGGRDVRR